MSEREAYRRRVETARAALERTSLRWGGEPGPADPETGERWDGPMIAGHLAEMLPYWTAQIRSVIEGGAPEIGRGAAGYEARRRAIDGAGALGEGRLRLRIERGVEDLLTLIEAVPDAAWDRPLTWHTRPLDRRMPLKEAFEELLVGHLEAHLSQLAALSPP